MLPEARGHGHLDGSGQSEAEAQGLGTVSFILQHEIDIR